MESTSQNISRFCELSQDISNTQHTPHTSSFAPNKTIKRIIISRIVLENFKSYFGKHVIEPLHKRFNTIVGPNGNGKSNLLEAIMFVFGKKAKKIRLKRLKELIHSSQNHDDITHASVEVHFDEIVDDTDDSDKYTIIENSQFSIKRTVTQSSASKYYLNDQECKFEEIAKMLIRKGIDLENNRFIILQGEVEQISLMKPTCSDSDQFGFLEYLEDIMGTYRFCEEMDKIVPAVKEVRDKKNNILTVLNQEYIAVQSSEREKENVKNFLYKESLLCKISILLYSVMGYSLNMQIAECNEAIKKHNDEVEESEANKRKILEEHKKENSILSEIDLKRKEIYSERNKIKEEIQKTTQNDIALNAEIGTIESNNENINEQINEIGEEYTKLIETITSQEREIDTQQKELGTHKTMYTDMEKEYNEYNKSIEQKISPLKDKKILILGTQLSKRKEESTKLGITLREKKAEYSSLTEQINKKKQHVEKLSEQITMQTTNLQDSKEQLKVIDEKLQTMKPEKQETANIIANLIKQKEELEGQLRSNMIKVNYARNERESMSRVRKIINDLMDAQRQGMLSGIYGRLGDLGKTDPKFEIAVCSACSCLDYIVVESVTDSNKVINYLKQYKIGMANLLILQKISESSKPTLFNAPQGSLRVFDLIKLSDPKFGPAFYFGLKNTLLMDSLKNKQTMELAYGRDRHRVVTLDGSIIENNGIMSGGGEPRRGYIKLTTDGEALSGVKIEELNKMISECSKKVNELSEELMKKGNDLKAVEQEIRDYEQEQSKLHVSTTMYNKAISNLEIELKKSKMNENNEHKKELEESQKSIESIEENLNKINQEASKLQEQVEDLDKQILEVGGNEFREKEKNYHNAKSEYDEFNKNFTILKAQFQANKAKIDELKDSEQKLKCNLESNKARKIIIEEQKSKNEEDIIEQAGKSKELDDKAKQIEEIIKGKKEIIDQVKRKIEEAKKQIVEAKDKIEEQQNKIAEIMPTYKEHISNANKHKNKYKESLKDYKSIEGIKNAEDKLKKLKENQMFQDDLKENIKKQSKEGEEIKEEDIKLDKNAEHKEEVKEENKEKEQMKTQEGEQKIKQETTIEAVANSVDVLEEISVATYSMLKDQIKQMEIEITTLENNLKRLDKDINPAKRYMEQVEKITGISNEYDAVNKEYEEHRQKYELLKTKRLNQFLDGFNKINTYLGETYKSLTDGGEAKLDLVDQTDPFIDGVTFRARPPNKSWRPISKLSGGEKTLSSLSFLFALHMFKPSPLFCMDEIDAALDHGNVAVVARYIKTKTQDSQFLVISLRNRMLESSYRTVGVYKLRDLSQNIIFNPRPSNFLQNKKIALDKEMLMKMTNEIATPLRPLESLKKSSLDLEEKILKQSFSRENRHNDSIIEDEENKVESKEESKEVSKEENKTENNK